MNLKTFAAIGLGASLCAGGALAGVVPYPNAGHENPNTYTFAAASTGDVIAYFAAQSGASYDEQVGLTQTGVQGLDDHSSSVGDSLDLGAVTKGETLTFFDDVISTSNVWSSDPAANSDGGNHVYSTTVTAGQLYANSPAGIYIGFEDEAFPGSDFNYADDTFIVTNVLAVPEPSVWAMMLVGFGGLGVAMRSRRKQAAVAA